MLVAVVSSARVISISGTSLVLAPYVNAWTRNSVCFSAGAIFSWLSEVRAKGNILFSFNTAMFGGERRVKGGLSRVQ